jgi:hypothetical protein
MGPRWVSLTYASLHNLFGGNLSGTKYLVSTFVKFFLFLFYSFFILDIELLKLNGYKIYLCQKDHKRGKM